MAKNNYLIESMKAFYQQRSYLVEGTYAAIGIAMYEMGYDQDEIIDVFARSQQIWDEHDSNVEGMIAKCGNDTGICLKGVKKGES